MVGIRVRNNKYLVRFSHNKKRIAKNLTTLEEAVAYRDRCTEKYSDKSLEGEIWEEVENYSRYRFSNLGRILSLNYKNGILHKVVKPAIDEGYAKTMLMDDSGITKTIKVHRMVAEAFYGSPPKDAVINHLNGIKDDNRIENLEWCTQSHNALHSFEAGLQKAKTGELNGMSKLTEPEVLAIREMKRKGGRFWGRNQIAAMLDVSPKTLQHIVNKPEQSWKNT